MTLIKWYSELYNLKLIKMELLNFEEYNLYPGRFQPPHKGHMTIFNESLDKGEKVCIAIRNIQPDEKNPLSAEQVKKLWEKVYEENNNVKVIIIPNIKSVKYGRTVGFSVDEIKPSADICSISATQIRSFIKSGSDEWRIMVNEKIHEDIIELLK